MNKTKKLTVIALCIIMIFSTLSVMADSAEIKTDITDDSVVITGTLNNDRANSGLIVRMQDSNGNDVLAETTKSFFKEDEVVFQFDKIMLPKALISGNYTFKITGTDLSNAIIIPYEYVGPDKVLEILIAIRDASDKGGKIKENRHYLSIDTADYDKLTPQGKILFESVIRNNVFDLPENSISDQDREKIKTEAKKLLAAYDNAICLSLFESIEKSDDVKYWLDKYYKALEFDKNDPGTEYDEVKITAYLEDVKGGNTFTEKLKGATGQDTKDKIKACLYESALLSVITDERGSDVMEMMLAFPQLFDINDTGLNKLSVYKKAECFNNIAGKSFASYADATDALNDEIDKALGGDGGNDGGSGGGGGRGGSVAAEIQKQPEDSEKEQTASFTDIDDKHWAYEAVMLLSKRGIISGYNDGSFAPENNVTRAEFIKMVVVAMSVNTGDKETPFKDVAGDAWYAPYAAAAYRTGIVLGDEYGNFNPDANITREDMVTMLYRAMQIEEKGESITFTDAALISDYAKDATAYFSKRGIVNGMGDGRFAPKENATRAQAAKIFYNIINM